MISKISRTWESSYGIRENLDFQLFPGGKKCVYSYIKIATKEILSVPTEGSWLD